MNSRHFGALLLVGHFGALLLAGHLACEARTVVCPPGTFADHERAGALLAAACGAEKLAPEDVTICFGAAARGTVRHDGIVVLPDSPDHEAMAARLAHLGLHVADGLYRFPVAGVPCERQIEAALAAEARAIVAEIEACDQLGCTAAPYTFAGAVLAATPDERTEQVLLRLRAEPEADGLNMLVRGYRKRCTAEGVPRGDSGATAGAGP